MPDTTSFTARFPAILLLGPTGSGKTPLGDLLEERGFRGNKCLHFDFGENLRRIAALDTPRPPITQADVDFVKQVLQTGELLEDKHFPLAERIFRLFLADPGADQETLIVLNGLPRHGGQAEAIDRLVDIKAVISLDCSGDVVLRRIGSNVGGDRTGRADDDLDAVQRKLTLFARRTAPLVDHYRLRHVPILAITVRADSTPEQVWQAIHR
jgi:adenylate kinase family enzyme